MRHAGRFVRMHLHRLLQDRANRGTRIGSLALALMLASTIISPAARADAAVPGVSQSAPPSYPDADHVCNGCHLSTIRYLSRFLAEYPAEHGEPLVINMMNADRTRGMHTMALISWHGQAWGRDEYFGVFSLGCRFEKEPDLSRLAACAESAYQQHARRVIRMEGTPRRPDDPEQMSRAQRFQEVTLATRIIPFPSSIYWLRSGREEFPVAFFRPSGGQIAVYDPLHGTCLAECSSPDDVKVVSLVAAQLGYRPDHVRSDVSTSNSNPLAYAGAQR
jgi:hypothetical protein